MVGDVRHRHSWSSRAALAAGTLAVLSTAGCATILGTVVSPLTGGVGLVESADAEPAAPRVDTWVPFVFVGGMIAGPFVALYNGIRHDVSVFRGAGPYWDDMGLVFRPFEMIATRS